MRQTNSDTDMIKITPSVRNIIYLLSRDRETKRKTNKNEDTKSKTKKHDNQAETKKLNEEGRSTNRPRRKVKP